MNGQIQMPPPPDFLSKEDVALLKRTMLAQFREDEQETFVRVCQRTKLDPFTKQIYPTRRYSTVRDEGGQKKKVPTLVTVTGIMGLTALAERTHDYDGCEIAWAGKDGQWKDEWLEPEPPAAARCIIYHKHHSHPEVGIARWEGYVGQQWDNDAKKWYITDFWAKMPDFMLAKCAKAQALRGAFPDQLSNVYIREELDSDISDSETETAAIPTDEQKILDNRKREEEIKASGRFQMVEEKPSPVPTPAEMAEPADVHKIPPKPEHAVRGPQEAPGTKPPVEPLNGPELSSPTTEITDAPPPWADHVIKGVTHVRYHRRKIGELNPAELATIEQQWLPAIREQWDNATDDQRADAEAFERAIAYHKMQRPF